MSSDLTPCPRCDRTNPRGASYCLHCGRALVDRPFCPRCYLTNPPDAAFCASCGGALPTMIPDARARPDFASELLRHNTRTRWALGVVAGGMCLYFAAIFSQSHPGDPTYDRVHLTLAAAAMIAALFAVFFVNRFPFGAAVLGLIGWAALLGYEAAADPLDAWRGWVLKSLVLLALLGGLSTGFTCLRIAHRRRIALAADPTIPPLRR